MTKITLVNADCLDYMRSISRVFDMILVDPPIRMHRKAMGQGCASE